MSAPPAVIITTRLPPQICGIGAYSWLAHKHRPNHSAPACFLVLEGAAESRTLLSFDAITDFNGDPRRLGQALDRAGPANVLLHYAGRAYQRRVVLPVAQQNVDDARDLLVTGPDRLELAEPSFLGQVTSKPCERVVFASEKADHRREAGSGKREA